MPGMDPGAAGTFSPGAAGPFALVADRSQPRKAPPPNFALLADSHVPTGAVPAGFSLIADERLTPARVWSQRAIYIALAIAFLLHLAVLTPFMLKPAPTPADRVRELGTEDGALEHLNVTVVSDADLKRLSSDPFKQEAPPPTPAPAEAPAPPPEPQVEPQPEQRVEKPQERQEPQDAPVKEASAEPAAPQKSDNKKDVPFDVSGFIAQASEQFGSQLKQAVQAHERREATRSVQSGNVKSFRPGASHLGKSDEWERKVIWALSATKPMGNGKWGSAVVTFVISDGGQVQGLRLIKSSGDTWLDQGALLAVKQARMPIPPPDLPVGDRAFNIEYISLPN